jgi:hypothetical protein
MTFSVARKWMPDLRLPCFFATSMVFYSKTCHRPNKAMQVIAPGCHAACLRSRRAIPPRYLILGR